MYLFICKDLIQDIKDPEHPHTLEELNVVREECVSLCPLHSSTTQCCHGAGAAAAGKQQVQWVWLREQVREWFKLQKKK